MQGKILIVDAIATNRIVLKIKLSSSFYDVVQATSVAEALDLAKLHSPDLVITAATLPDADAGALCGQLATTVQTARIPVMAVCDSEDVMLRRGLLASGAQDVLVKPLQDALLLGRVRSLIRAHHSAEEWHMRDEASRVFGLAEPQNNFVAPGVVQLVSDDKALTHVWATQLRMRCCDKVSISSQRDALNCLKGNVLPDAFILVLNGTADSDLNQMHLISSIRANAGTRDSGVLVLQLKPDAVLGANALDLGADDLMSNGYDLEELALRLTGLIARKRRADKIRISIDAGLREAIHDPLTGLYNRRFALSELSRLADASGPTDRPFAVMLADMDHFKRVNDAFGHASGDAVLVETARRLRGHLRPIDLAARIGGEEFLLILPGITELEATQIAERLCTSLRDTPFKVPGCIAGITITASIGICMGGSLMGPDISRSDRAAALVDRADQALYAAKSKGRNCVRLNKSAA